MPVTLCFDFGNTRLKCAVFHDNEIAEIVTLDNDNKETIADLIDRYRPGKSLLSSVINHNPEMEDLLADAGKFHKLTHHSKLPVTTPVGKPETIGADRLALVVAATSLYPENH